MKNRKHNTNEYLMITAGGLIVATFCTLIGKLNEKLSSTPSKIILVFLLLMALAFAVLLMIRLVKLLKKDFMEKRK